MIVEEIKGIKSGRRELRQFGLTVGIVFGLLGLLFWWRDREIYPLFLALSVGLIFFGLTLPTFLKPIQKGWMTLGILLGWVMTRVILIFSFFVIITPIGLLARAFGQIPLQLKPDKNLDTYWIRRDTSTSDSQDFERQF